MDQPSAISKQEDVSMTFHMSNLPLYQDEHLELQEVRNKKDSIIQPESELYYKEDYDLGSQFTMKKNRFSEYRIDIPKKQTSTFDDPSKISPKQSPSKDLNSRNSGIKEHYNFLDADNPSMYQGSVYTKSKNEKPVPRRLMRAINLLVNVKSFYNQLTKNTRIFQRITPEQYNLIGDKASFYSSHLMQSMKNKKKKGIIYQILQKIIQEIIRHYENIPIIEPHKNLKTMWDSIQGILVILIILFFSMVIVFGLDPHEYMTYLQATLVLFSVDILIQFNTGIVVKGSVVFQRGEIAKTYLKGNFMMDIIGLLPIIQVNSDIITDGYYGSDSKRNVPQVLFQATVLLKCFVLRDIFDRLEQRFGYQKNLENIIDLLKLLFTIGSICHFFSLLWYGLGDYEINVLKNKDSWLPFVGITEADVYTKYIYSFYYVATTMITVGYGDITPQNAVEVTFSVITMFLTGVVYAYSLNCIGNILDNINESNKDFRRDMRTMHHLMAEENVKQSLRVKISNYVEYLCKESNNQKKAKQDEIVSKLSEKLRNELMNEIKGKFISDIPLFKDIITQLTQHKILEQMQECLFSPGEVIFQHNDIDDCAIYYVLKGQVKISLEEQVHRTVKLIEKRGCFGEISFITGNQRTGTATATDFCRIYKIKRENFYKILRENDQDFENFQMLYEAVCLKGNLKFAKLYCYSCKRGDHLAQFCPKTHLIFSKQILLQKYNKTQPIIERQNTFRHKFRFNSRLICHNIQDALVNLHSHPENEEVLRMLEEVTHLNDSYLELYYGDEEQSQYDMMSVQHNLNKKESMQDKLMKERQLSAQDSNYMKLDKNDLTPSESSGDDEYTSSVASHDTTTLEQNSASEFSSKKKKKNGSKKGSNRQNKNKKNRFSDVNENVIEESSEDSIQDTQSQSISNATKFGNKLTKPASKLNRDSELSAFSVKENNEEGFQQMDDQSRRYFKEFEEDYYAKSGLDTFSKNSLHQNKQSMKSLSGMTSSQLGSVAPQLQPKRKSLHQEVLEKQYNQLFNDNEGYQNFKNLVNINTNSGTPLSQGFTGDKYIPSQSALSNVINQQNQSIIGFNDINISTNNLEESQVREKKSNSVSAQKFKIEEPTKQIAQSFRKSVSFDPNYFHEIQRSFVKKQVSGSINKISTRQTEESGHKRQFKPISSMSSYSKIPSALKNNSYLAHQFHTGSSINAISGQVNSSLKRTSTKNFKRQSTKTQTRESSVSFTSNQNYNTPMSPTKGIMKRCQDGRSQLQQSDMKIIQMNEEKLKEIYDNQKQQYNDDFRNPAMYNGSKEEIDANEEILITDSLKNYNYYYPQCNAHQVIKRYSQFMSDKTKALKKRPTIMGKSIKGRIKRAINSKKSPTGNGNSTPLTLFNIQDKNQVFNLDKSQVTIGMDKSQKSIMYYNSNIKTNLMQSTEKITTHYDVYNSPPAKFIFSNAAEKINVIETPHKFDDFVDEG